MKRLKQFLHQHGISPARAETLTSEITGIADTMQPMPRKQTSGIKRMPVEVYSRVVGYFRPVNQWNKGKQDEFNNRNELDPHAVEEQLTKLISHGRAKERHHESNLASHLRQGIVYKQ